MGSKIVILELILNVLVEKGRSELPGKELFLICICLFLCLFNDVLETIFRNYSVIIFRNIALFISVIFKQMESNKLTEFNLLRNNCGFR